MIRRMRLTPARIAAQLALVVPVLAVEMLIFSNMSSTGQWAPPAIVAGTVALFVATIGVLLLANHVANSVADRARSTRLPWVTYGATLTSVWAMVVALVFTGAQFQATDSGYAGGFTVWAAGFAAVCVISLLAATAVGIVAIGRAALSPRNL